MVDKETEEPEVMSTKTIEDLGEETEQPVIPEVLISKEAFDDTVEEDKSLQVVIQTIKEANPALANIKPSNAVIQEMSETSKITIIFEIEEKKERVVVVYN